MAKGIGAKSLNKGKGNVAKPSVSKTTTSTSPSTSLRDKAKDCPVVTVTMLQDLAGELQAIEQESFDDGHNPELPKRVTWDRRIVRIYDRGQGPMTN